ncbi:hypothetical protein NMY22_g10267 [Coprinellus aureogranulatus]|nr:hypothetical protein NMY22_g10267 [Coprinellus aureogranulatus]
MVMTPQIPVERYISAYFPPLTEVNLGELKVRTPRGAPVIDPVEVDIPPLTTHPGAGSWPSELFPSVKTLIIGELYCTRRYSPPPPREPSDVKRTGDISISAARKKYAGQVLLFPWATGAYVHKLVLWDSGEEAVRELERKEVDETYLTPFGWDLL